MCPRRGCAALRVFLTLKGIRVLRDLHVDDEDVERRR